ncbi:ABC transporter substrate-binding protein [Siccirubricoccus sp. KC 17139]|uniref:ABC transporter substrate-binding protein n=1 Tax=Siccirubricoccus soli TaxID=2899147 RepID=A0ABT1D1I3_9PROT|nr:ABC transporter substrate-binding protein [Siccirubricoccus soli]MCO6415776.1 ABC transporter substrate-binding protein [Siccirubricoccus soli]MCP2681908.1 ABC transporter substrate-binding protein [Siccirubricoccus soli]
MSAFEMPRRAALSLALAGFVLPAGAQQAPADPLLYGPTDPKAKRGGRVTIGSLVEPPALDPFRQAADARIRVSVLMYQGLFFEDQTGVARPLLAESASPSADGKSWTFRLRRGVKFHTGAAMTSADVKYSYDFMRNPANGSPGAGDLSSVAEIEAPDEHTVVFKLSRANAALPMTLTNKYGAVVPKGFLDEANSGTRMNEVSVGTGPFRLKQFRPNSTLVLERNRDYWEPGLPYLDEITFVTMPNSAAMVVGLQSRRIDLAMFSRPQDTQALQNAAGVEVHRWPSLNQKSIDLDCKYGPLADVRVRQAIALGIDKKTVMDASIAGYGTVLGTMVAGMQEGWGVPLAELANQKVDLEKARALLRDAGHTNGLDIDLTTIIGYDWMDPAAVTIAEQLRRIDIRVTIKKVELGVWIRNFRAREMGFTFNDWGTTPDPSLLFYRHFRAAPEGADFRNWNNARASALLDQGQETADPTQRRAIYAEFQKILAEEVPTIMLFSADVLTANRTRLKNYVQHGTGWYFGLAKAWVEG